MEGTLEVRKNRKGLENENCYCEKKVRKALVSTVIHLSRISVVNQQKFSHFHTVHFKNCFSVRGTTEVVR